LRGTARRYQKMGDEKVPPLDHVETWGLFLTGEVSLLLEKKKAGGWGPQKEICSPCFHQERCTWIGGKKGYEKILILFTFLQKRDMGTN